MPSEKLLITAPGKRKGLSEEAARNSTKSKIRSNINPWRAERVKI